MNVTSSTVLAVLVLGFAAAAPARAVEPVSQDMPPVEACAKTINAMGGSMGHEPGVGSNGKPIYKFILRTAGVDYDAVCDAATGVVQDVTRRFAH